MSEIQTIRFDGDNLQTVRDGDKVWVVLKRACEALGLPVHTQAEKLKSKTWADTRLVRVTAEDGKSYETFCLDLDSLPMWLATIDVGRVRIEAREKLTHYQRECARVLRDHFYGTRTDLSAVWDAIAGLTEGHRQLVAQHQQLAEGQRQIAQAVQSMASVLGNLERQVSWLTQQVGSGGVVAPSKLHQMRLEVRSIAALEAAGGRHKNPRAASADLYREMGELTDWGGKGKPWAELPTALVPAAFAVLRRRRRDAERALCVRPKQLRIVDIEAHRARMARGAKDSA